MAGNANGVAGMFAEAGVNENRQKCITFGNFLTL
jgi:hypothetical protein